MGAFDAMYDGMNESMAHANRMQSNRLINQLSNAEATIQDCYREINALRAERERLQSENEALKSWRSRVSGRLSDINKNSDALGLSQGFLLQGIAETYRNKYHPNNTPWSMEEARSYNLILIAGFKIINDLIYGTPKMMGWAARTIKHLREGGKLPPDLFELIEKEAVYHAKLFDDMDIWDRAVALAKEWAPQMEYADPLYTWPTEESLVKLAPFMSRSKIDKYMGQLYNNKPFSGSFSEKQYFDTPLTDTEMMGLDRHLIPKRMPYDDLMPNFYK